ncbi:unnamed protein product [Clonostachys rosea]|uniref:Reticulon domain-containing protein n=1 Tax=Bionectria ochroleuca TaxID=29856 RepID=A0ABY6UQ18_BIOOC|nr:unnamed protein product [Clonostachys rosea]
MAGLAPTAFPVEGKDFPKVDSKASDVTATPAQAQAFSTQSQAFSTQPQSFAVPRKTVHNVPGEGKYTNQPRTSTLKNMVNPDSLYKYTSWEDPVRTLGSYIGIMSLLCGAHYMPLTQSALKAGATLLGVTATVEYAHRSFTRNTILARLRPAEYKKIPEPVLNDTLKDVHDLVQYLVVEAQRVVLGENLGRTFGAFVTLATLYWLVKIVSPFGLVLLGVTALYAAPLVTSRQGREVLEAAKARTADISNAALENSQALAQAGMDKAAGLSTATQQTAADAKRRAGELVQGGITTSTATDENADALMDAAKNTIDKSSTKPSRAIGQDEQTTRPIRDTTAVLPNKNVEHTNVSNTGSRAFGQDDKQTRLIRDTTAIHPERVEEKMNISANTPVGAGKLSDPLLNPSTTASGTTTASGMTKDHTHKYAEPASRLPVSLESHLADAGLGSARQNQTDEHSDGHYALKNTRDGLKDVAQSTPRHHDASTTVATSSAAPGLASEEEKADTSILNRPRAIPHLSNLDQTSPAFGKH